MAFDSSALVPAHVLAGRTSAMPVPGHHHVLGVPLDPPPDGENILLGMGCFWGAERKFWQAEFVRCTAVGYAGGATPNPTYEEVCSGRTGHSEVVRITYPAEHLQAVLQLFWESHDPTQGMRQGHDRGTQYRSTIYGDAGQLATAQESLQRYQERLRARGFGAITTELRERQVFYFAEAYHQQYLAKNPGGYCGLGGTGVEFDGC